MFNWLDLSDRATVKAATHINLAEEAAKKNDALRYQLNTVDAARYNLIGQYCLLRWHRRLQNA